MRLCGDSASAYATFWCFCFQLCSVFGGQICFKEAIMLVKYATLWLFTLPLSPCNLYVLFTSHFRLIYSGLSWRHHTFLFYCVHNVVFNACMYACMHVCKVYICVHTTTRHIPHFVGDGEINSYHISRLTQSSTLCCAAGVKRSNSRGPTAPRETVGPRTLSTFSPLQ